MTDEIQTGTQCIVSMRYTMKNAAGEVLADNLLEQPVKFLYGSGEILAELEVPLAGLKIGERKCFSLSPETVPEFNETYYFDVIIDDILTGSQLESNKKLSSESCGPDCDC